MPERANDSVAEGNCIRREAGWGATGSELSVRRITNLFRRGESDEPAFRWRSLEGTGHAAVADKAMTGRTTWLGTERWEEVAQEAVEIHGYQLPEAPPPAEPPPPPLKPPPPNPPEP